MQWPLPPWPMVYVFSGVTAFLLAAFLTPVLVRLLTHFEVMDQVSPEKIHTKPIPRGGGIVIFLAFAIAVLLPNYRDNPMKGVMVGAFICLVVGALDDWKGGIPAVIKLGALTVATLVMSAFGVQVTLFSSFALNLFVTWLWIVGVTSAFNGIDNMDGLSTGIAVIVSSMFLLIATQSYYAAGTETSLAWFGLLASGLIGACLGFLIHNFFPAKVFMGDAGSFFLGFTLAALGVMGEWSSQNAVVSCTIPILILGIPIFDFAYTVLSRIIHGQTTTLRQIIEHCDMDHLSHRLVNIGFSQRGAVLLIYLMAVGLGTTGILLRNSGSLLDIALSMMQAAAVLSVIVMLVRTAAKKEAGIQELQQWQLDTMESLSLLPKPKEAKQSPPELEKSA